MKTPQIGEIYEHCYFPTRQIQILDVFECRHVPCAKVKYIKAWNPKNVGMTSTITLYYIEARYDRISYDNKEAEWEV